MNTIKRFRPTKSDLKMGWHVTIGVKILQFTPEGKGCGSKMKWIKNVGISDIYDEGDHFTLIQRTYPRGSEYGETYLIRVEKSEITCMYMRCDIQLKKPKLSNSKTVKPTV